jgi:uncharacterized phage infection (PIP) family protein YhgE
LFNFIDSIIIYLLIYLFEYILFFLRNIAPGKARLAQLRASRLDEQPRQGTAAFLAANLMSDSVAIPDPSILNANTSLMEQVAQLTRQLRESESQINEMLIERNQIQNLQRTCAHLSEEVDNQRQIFERVQGQNKGLRSELAAANEQVSTLTEEVMHLKYELSASQPLARPFQKREELNQAEQIANLQQQLQKQASLISSQCEQVAAAATAHQAADTAVQQLSDQLKRIRRLFEQGLELSNVIKQNAVQIVNFIEPPTSTEDDVQQDSGLTKAEKVRMMTRHVFVFAHLNINYLVNNTNSKNGNNNKNKNKNNHK